MKLQAEGTQVMQCRFDLCFLLCFQVGIANMFAESSSFFGTYLDLNYVYSLPTLPIYSRANEQSTSILTALYVCFYVFHDDLSSSLTTSDELLEVSRKYSMDDTTVTPQIEKCEIHVNHPTALVS